jgi:hypothetical protein
MNHSGDAAEQIVRLSLEGVEVAARIAGSAAKEIALFLLAALKNKNKNLKLKGKARLTAMLKSGKALEIYSVKEGDLKKFASGAKEYGIVYCVLRNTKNTPDGLCDIMVKAEDAPKITRLAERFQFATVDKAKIESKLVAEKAERTAAVGAEGAELETPEINDTEALLDDLLGAEQEAPDRNDADKLPDDLPGTGEGKAAPNQRDAGPNAAHGAGRENEVSDNSPLAGGAPPKADPSAPTSGNRSNSERGTSSRPSVKAELRKIKAARKSVADAPVRGDTAVPDKPQDRPAATTHRQPPRRGGKPKSHKMKGSR